MRIKTLLAASLVAGAIALFPQSAVGFDATHLPACHHEDGSGQAICVWNAHTSGNGVGQSFIAVRGGTDRARYVNISQHLANRLG